MVYFMPQPDQRFQTSQETQKNEGYEQSIYLNLVSVPDKFP